MYSKAPLIVILLHLGARGRILGAVAGVVRLVARHLVRLDFRFHRTRRGLLFMPSRDTVSVSVQSFESANEGRRTTHSAPTGAARLWVSLHAPQPDISVIQRTPYMCQFLRENSAGWVALRQLVQLHCDVTRAVA